MCNCKILKKKYILWLYPFTKTAITPMFFKQIENFQCLKSSTTSCLSNGGIHMSRVHKCVLKLVKSQKSQIHMCLIWRHTEPMGLKNIGFTLWPIQKHHFCSTDMSNRETLGCDLRDVLRDILRLQEQLSSQNRSEFNQESISLSLKILSYLRPMFAH